MAPSQWLWQKWWWWTGLSGWGFYDVGQVAVWSEVDTGPQQADTASPVQKRMCGLLYAFPPL